MNVETLMLTVSYEEIPDDDALIDELITLVDRAVAPRASPAKKRRTSGKSVWRFLSNLLFYSALMLAIVAALVYSAGPGEIKSLFGYSYFTVMTPSMESSIPPGSLIVTKKTDANQLQIGDVITFFSYDADSTVTHRIVEIINDGELSFRTKGDDNQSEDPDPVPAKRLVGKVVFHLGAVGSAMLLLQKHLILVLVLFFLAIALSFTLQQLLRKEDMARVRPQKKRNNTTVPIPATGYG
jgi:signal peptidase I, archaeal type